MTYLRPGEKVEGSGIEPPELPPALQAAVARYANWADQHSKISEYRDHITDPLYHYTDLAGALGIIGGTIWFNDIRQMTDTSELRFGMKMAHAAMRKVGEEKGASGFLMKMATDLLSPRNLRIFDFYVACLTRLRDDLSQWRAYGADGKGFAVGIAPHIFKPEPSSLPMGETFVVSPVVYDPAKVSWLHTESALVASSIVTDAYEQHPAALGDRTIGIEFSRQLAMQLVASPAIWNCVTTKHPAFAPEQEVRAAMLGQPGTLARFVKTRDRQRRLVNYIPLAMLVSDPTAVVEVVAGPSATSDAVQQVRDAMARLPSGAMAKLSRSKIPYRSR